MTFLWSSPRGHSPSPAGCEEQPEGKVWLGEVGTQRAEIHPPAGRPVFLPCSLFERAEQVHPEDSPSCGCPLPTNGRRMSLVGAARGKKAPALCQPVASDTTIISSPPLGKANFLPLLSLARFPAAKGQHVPQNHTRDDLQEPS